MPILSGNERLKIARTGYYMEAVTYGQPDEQPGVLVNLRDPSGTIIDRAVITAPVDDGIPRLNILHNSGAEDKSFFKGEEG